MLHTWRILMKASLYPQLNNASNEWTTVFRENRTRVLYFIKRRQFKITQNFLFVKTLFIYT